MASYDLNLFTMECMREKKYQFHSIKAIVLSMFVVVFVLRIVFLTANFYI